MQMPFTIVRLKPGQVVVYEQDLKNIENAIVDFDNNLRDKSRSYSNVAGEAVGKVRSGLQFLRFNAPRKPAERAEPLVIKKDR